jgi:hypothetical protein
MGKESKFQKNYEAKLSAKNLRVPQNGNFALSLTALCN